MNRLVRLVARQPTLFATRRAPLLSPRLRRYASQKPTPESLYAEYLNSRRPPVDLHEPGAKNYPPPEPVTFEMFQEILAQSPLDVEWDGEGENEAADTDLDLDKKYDSMLEALQEMESSDRALTALDQMDTSDPGFIDALGTLSPQELEKMAGRVLDLMAPPIDDPVFEERLENIGGEVRPAREVAWRVAQIVQSTTDKAKLERIENALATYNGPLSVLNAHVEWYLSNPGEIEAEERHYNNKLEMQADMIEDGPKDEEEARLFDDIWAEPTHDNNSYYRQKTPVDELAQHLRNRDVQYAIKSRMTREDRNELFRLMDNIVAPVFNEDMSNFYAIADIFAKYEDVELVYRTQPRLPRISRLDVFKRLLPDPDADPVAQQQEEENEIAQILEEKQQKRAAVQAEKDAKRGEWPNLMTRDPLLDSREVLELPPTKDTPFHNRVIIRNHHSIFNEALEADGFDFNNSEIVHTKSDDPEQVSETAEANIPIDPKELEHLILFPVVERFARLQTSKGNKDRAVRVYIVGDGKGMVGIGWGKHAQQQIARSKAISDAVRNMDWVERFEDRTIWTEVRTKHGATTVILRPRPVGFGLRCNPYVHRLLTAAGIKDISAKVWGSRNKIGVLKATLRLLHAGHAPLGMGDGVGGPGRKSHKGTGLRNKNQIERARGRRLIDLRV